jgi:hypothetical protein
MDGKAGRCRHITPRSPLPSAMPGVTWVDKGQIPGGMKNRSRWPHPTSSPSWAPFRPIFRPRLPARQALAQLGMTPRWAASPKRLAPKHMVRVAISDTLNNIRIGTVHQTAESDTYLLMRPGQEIRCAGIGKKTDGLIFGRIGENAAGENTAYRYHRAEGDRNPQLPQRPRAMPIPV